jgi:hypothetical protein
MKYLTYEDKEGFVRRVYVKDGTKVDDAEQGIPAGPPDLRIMDWDGLFREMNNALAANGCFTWRDVQRKPVGVQAALSIVKRAIISLYRDQENDISLNKE